MARYQFDESTERGAWLERGTSLTQFVVRAFGLVLMIVGLWIAFAVLAEAWSLYKDPANIEHFARAIEQGSNLDRALSSVSRGEQPPAADPAEIIERAPAREPAPPGFRLSYFVAWVLALLLLMLVGRLAIAAIRAGGELVLYDVHIKRFARELARESVRIGSTAEGR